MMMISPFTQKSVARGDAASPASRRYAHRPYASAAAQQHNSGGAVILGIDAIKQASSRPATAFSEPSDDTRSSRGSAYSTASSRDSAAVMNHLNGSRSPHVPSTAVSAPTSTAVAGMPPPPAYSAAVGAHDPALPLLPPRMQPPALPQPPQTARNLQRRHDPYASLPSTPLRNRVVHGISHQPLVGQCRYVAWPAIEPTAHVPAAFHPGLPRLVVEQVKFELTGPQLRWLIHKLAGVVPVRVIDQQRGSLVAYFKNDQDLAAAQALHRAVLFDHHGAWAPLNADESAAVSRYMASREFRQRGQRLPRELMSLTARKSTSPVGPVGRQQ